MKKNIFIQLGFILVLVGLIYHSTFVWLYARYMAADSYYSHGFLVPFVTWYLIWVKKEQLENIDKKCSLWGLVLIIFSLSLHFLSTLAEVFFVSGFSILFLVFGISLFLYGKQITKKILFPLSFLIFMFPLPLVAINAISFPMKMFATKSAVFILQKFMHIPMKNEGFQIFFPKASLVVGNPCSGLRSLISMLALGSIFAYLLKANMFKKNVLFFSAIPIALFSNIIRVIMLCLGVFIYGSQMTKGLFHDLTGYLVFVIAFVGLWLCWGKLEGKGKNKQKSIVDSP